LIGKSKQEFIGNKIKIIVLFLLLTGIVLILMSF